MKIVIILFTATILFAFNIKTTPVTLKTFTNSVSGYGVVKSLEKSEIIALESGIVSYISKLPGEIVNKNEKLFIIIPNPLHKNLLEKKLMVKKADKQLFYIKKEFDLIKKLYYANVSSKKELLEIKNRYELAKIESIKAQKQLNNLLKQHIYYAPTRGIISKVKVINGNYVKEGEVVIELTDTDKKIVVLEVFDEKNILKTGMPLKIKANKHQSDAKIVSIAPERTKSGSYLIYCKFTTKSNYFNPGDFVKGIIEVSFSNFPSVPLSAIIRDNDNIIVLVKTSKGYDIRKIKTGIISDGFIQVISGLKPGETIVTEGAYELFHKNIADKIKILD